MGKRVGRKVAKVGLQNKGMKEQTFNAGYILTGTLSKVRREKEGGKGERRKKEEGRGGKKELLGGKGYLFFYLFRVPAQTKVLHRFSPRKIMNGRE